ncbi:hypothetical protein D3C72_1685630 [compost metagenome]
MSSEVRSGRPAHAMQRTIQRLKACDAMIRPNSTSDNCGADVARCAEETMASRGEAGMYGWSEDSSMTKRWRIIDDLSISRHSG